MEISKFLQETVKLAAFRYARLGAPSYPYCLEPIQLATIAIELDRLKEVPGSIIEIGVARGQTTRFICEHLSCSNIYNQTVYALDTFSSFTKSDLDYEVNKRGKSLSEFRAFGYNDFEIWKNNFEKFPFVKAIKGDCSDFDYSTVGPIKFAFLDVDLYLPTSKSLPNIYDNLTDGGVILIDDVLDNNVYDGAYFAYMEFCEEKKIAPQIIGNKCGVIYRKKANATSTVEA